MLVNNGKEITNPSEVNLTFKRFYDNLFKKDINKSVSDIEDLLSQIELPTISDEDCVKCENKITEHDLLLALKSMPNNKTP